MARTLKPPINYTTGLAGNVKTLYLDLYRPLSLFLFLWVWWRNWKGSTRLFSLSVWSRVVSWSSAQYSSTLRMSLFSLCFPWFRLEFTWVSPTLSASHIALWYARASVSVLTAWKSHPLVWFFSLISYVSVLMLCISIISVMECTPCPLALMAASVMDPHCIAAKSWLNNLPLLWLERLSQLFNDVSMLEGWGAHRFTHTRTIDRLRRALLRTDWRGHARPRDKRNVSVISWSDSTGRKHQHATVRTRDCMQHADVLWG